MSEPVYEYVPGQGWVVFGDSSKHGRVSPSGRYVVMFRVDGQSYGHGWQNAIHKGVTNNLEVATIEYQNYLKNYSNAIRYEGWKFELWPAEFEVYEP